MFPWALAIPAPIPFVFDFTVEFGPVLLLATLALLDLSAVAVLRAALVANQRRPAAEENAVGSAVIPLRRPRPEKHQAAPPLRAA
jgi:hypothetical protein